MGEVCARARALFSALPLVRPCLPGSVTRVPLLSTEQVPMVMRWSVVE